jgi:hypothetical protein
VSKGKREREGKSMRGKKIRKKTKLDYSFCFGGVGKGWIVFDNASVGV